MRTQNLSPWFVVPTILMGSLVWGSACDDPPTADRDGGPGSDAGDAAISRPDSACRSMREGRRIHYLLEDTTFSEPTRL